MKCWCRVRSDGGVDIIYCNPYIPEAWAVAKTIFTRYQMDNPNIIGRWAFNLLVDAGAFPNTLLPAPVELRQLGRHISFADYLRLNGPIVPYTCTPMDTTDLPRDRTFRNAWEKVGTKCEVNMLKARGIHIDRIRAVRNVELAKLDGPEQVAIRRSNTAEVTRIRALKDQLADIPQTFDLSVFTTPESLKNAWPVELPRLEIEAEEVSTWALEAGFGVHTLVALPPGRPTINGVR